MAFDDPMATDEARSVLQENLANPKEGYWNKVRKAYENVKLKCHMMCGKSGSGSSEDTSSDEQCKFSKE